MADVGPSKHSSGKPHSLAPAYGSVFYPVGLKVSGERVLVAGGGRYALPEITRLLEFGAMVDVVAPHVMSEIQDLAITHGHRLKVTRGRLDELLEEKIKISDYLLVLALNNRANENTRILNAASEAGVLCYGTDQIESSSFLIPAIFKRGHVKIGVSSDGICPSLEQALLHRIEASLVSEIDRHVLFANLVADRFDRLEAKMRQKVVRILADSAELYSAIQRGNFEEATSILDAIISDTKLEVEEAHTHTNQAEESTAG